MRLPSPLVLGLLSLLGAGGSQLVHAQDFSLSISPQQQTVWQAQAASVLVTVQGNNGFSGTVTLSASGLAWGETATFNPSSITTFGTSTLTVAAGPGTPTGSSSVTVTGTSGSLIHTATFSLNVVVPPPIQYTYDLAGRLTSVTDQFGQSALYSYDSVGNILSISREGATQLSIAAFSPQSATAGSSVSILGSGFLATASQNSVLFNGTSAVVASASPTVLTVTVPSGATTGPITVTNTNGSVTSSSSFTVISPGAPPTISSFSPTIAAGGTPLTITGTGFVAGLSNNVIQIGGAPAPTESATATTLGTIVPANAGSGHITVQTPSGTGISSDDFFFVPAPYTASTVALMTRAIPGTPTTATFTAAGQAAILIFDGVQGQQSRLLFNSTANDQTFLIYNPDGSQLMSRTALSSTGNIIDTPVFPSTGTYSLLINGSVGQTSVLVTSVPAVPNTYVVYSLPEFVQNYPSGPAFKVYLSVGPNSTSTVNFSASGLPAGVTPAFSIMSGSANAISQLTFTGTGSVAPGSYPFTISAQASGSLAVITNAVLNLAGAQFNVTATPGTQSVAQGGNAVYTVTATAIGSFSGTVTWSASGLPAGAAATFAPVSVTGTGSSTLTISTNATTPPGAYTVTVTGTSGSTSQSTTVTLSVSGPDFTLSVSPTSSSAQVGAVASYTVSVGSVAGFSGAVALSITGLPTGATASFNPTTVSPGGTSALTVNVGPDAAASSYNLVISGQSGSIQHTASTALSVQAADFTISLNTTLVTFPSTGGSVNQTLTMTVANSFTQAVSFTATGLPAGVTASFSPSSLSTAGTSTVTFTASAGAPAGIYSVTVVGMAASLATGTLSHSVPLTVIVNAAGALPSPWSSQDVGTPGLAGSSSVLANGYSVQGSGAGIGGSSDAFQYLYQGMSGDGTIIAHLGTNQNGSSSSQFGVMIRETLASGAVYAFAGITGSGQAQFLTRSTTNGGTSGSSASTPGSWLKLVRQAGNFSAFTSDDGSTWVQVGSTTAITMASSAYVGLAVSSTNNSSIVAGVFENATVLGSGADFYLAPVPPSRSAPVSVASTAYSSIEVGSINGFANTVNLTLSGLPAGVTGSLSAANASAGGESTLQLNISAAATAGVYPITITGTSGATSHTASVILTIGAVPSASLAPGWSSDDVGPVSPAGSAALSGSQVTIDAGTGQIDGTADAFHYVYQAVTGDSTLIIQAATWLYSDAARVGIEARDSLAPGAVNVCMCVYGYATIFGSGTYMNFQYRSTHGGSTTNVNNNPTATFPVWLKLVRQGNTFTGYTSADGINWTAISSQTVTMPQTIYIGIAVDYGRTAGTSSATLNNLFAPTGPDFSLNLLPSSQTSSDGNMTTYYSVLMTPLNDFAAPITYSVSGLPGSGFSSAFGTDSSPTMAITTDTTVAPGTYPFTVTGTSGALSHSTNGTLVVKSGNANTLPAPWSNADVGTPGSGSGSTYAAGTFTLNAATCCITEQGGSDAFQYVYQPLEGDGAIVAHVTTSYPSSPLLVMREDLTPTALSVVLGEPGTNQATFLTRSQIGGSYAFANGGIFGGPVWLKLARQGNNFSGYTSSDGVTWTQVGSTTSVPMATNIFVGLGTESGSGPSASTAIYDHVTVTTGSGFYLTATPSASGVNSGSSMTYNITVSPLLSFTGAVTLSASGLPGGATATFGTNPVTGGSGSSTLTISTTTGLAPGVYPFTITGTSGSVSNSVSATLTVENFSLSVAPSTQTLFISGTAVYTVTAASLDGFNSTVNLSVSGVPSGVTASWSSQTVTPTGSQSLTLTPGRRATTGTYTLTVTGTSGLITQTATFTVVVSSSPGYTVSASPTSQEIVAGNSTTYNLTIARFDSFTGSVTLSATNLPAGVTASFNPSTVTGTSSTLTITTSAESTPPGSYSFNVHSTSSLPAQDLPLTLIVDTPADFGITASSGVGAVGSSASVAVYVTGQNGFNAPVTLSVSGLPTGANGVFSPSSVNPFGQVDTSIQSTLSISNLAAGTYTFTVTGTSGSGSAQETHSVSATVLVESSPDFALNPSRTRIFAYPGNSTSFYANAVPISGFEGTVSLSISGLPAGGRVTFAPPQITGSSPSVVTIGTDPTLTVPGTYILSITGTSGALVKTASVTLTVVSQDFTLGGNGESNLLNVGGNAGVFHLTEAPVSGFNQTILYSASGQPTCAVPSWSADYFIGGTYENLNATTCQSSDVGTYTVTTLGIAPSGMTHAITDSLLMADFSIAASPTSVTASKGGTAVYNLSSTQNPSNASPIGFTTGTLPANVTASFSQNTGTSSVLTLTVGTKASSGTYTIQVKGQGTTFSYDNNNYVYDGSVRTFNITLVIQ